MGKCGQISLLVEVLRTLLAGACSFLFSWPQDCYTYHFVLDRITVPQRCVSQSPNLRKATFHSKRDFADVIKCKALEMGTSAWTVQVGLVSSQGEPESEAREMRAEEGVMGLMTGWKRQGNGFSPGAFKGTAC